MMMGKGYDDATLRIHSKPFFILFIPVGIAAVLLPLLRFGFAGVCFCRREG